MGTRGFQDVVQAAHVHRPRVLWIAFAHRRKPCGQVIDHVDPIPLEHTVDGRAFGHVENLERLYGRRRKSGGWCPATRGQDMIIPVPLPQGACQFRADLTEGAGHEDGLHRSGTAPSTHGHRATGLQRPRQSESRVGRLPVIDALHQRGQPVAYLGEH